MACIFARRFPIIAVNLTRRSISTTAVCKADKLMADPIEHATGLEKKELLAMAAGNDNPFDMRVYKRGAATKDNPTLIPSAHDKRMIGCICEEDSISINWMWLHKGEAKRCECGHWFKLKDFKPITEVY